MSSQIAGQNIAAWETHELINDFFGAIVIMSLDDRSALVDKMKAHFFFDTENTNVSALGQLNVRFQQQNQNALCLGRHNQPLNIAETHNIFMETFSSNVHFKNAFSQGRQNNTNMTVAQMEVMLQNAATIMDQDHTNTWRSAAAHTASWRSMPRSQYASANSIDTPFQDSDDDCEANGVRKTVDTKRIDKNRRSRQEEGTKKPDRNGNSSKLSKHDVQSLLARVKADPQALCPLHRKSDDHSGGECRHIKVLAKQYNLE